jgi:hypothetical protein
MSGPPSLSEIDLATVTIQEPKTLDNGGKIIYINMNKKPFIFRAPAMTAPYGMSDWDNTKFQVDLSLNPSEEVNAFVAKLKDFENQVIDEALNKSMAWFKKKYSSRDVVSELFSSAIKYSKNKETGEINNKYPPTIKLTMPFRLGKFECDAYNSKKELVPITPEFVNKGSKITAIVHCTGVWIAGSKFGCTYKVVQMRVQPNSSNAIFSKCAFVDDEDEIEA